MLHAHQIRSTHLMWAGLLRVQPIDVASQVLTWPGILFLDRKMTGCTMLRNWHAIGYFLHLNGSLVFLILTINELFVLLLSGKVGCHGIYLVYRTEFWCIVDFYLFCGVDRWDPFILVAFWLIVRDHWSVIWVRYVNDSIDRARKIIALCDGNRRS